MHWLVFGAGSLVGMVSRLPSQERVEDFEAMLALVTTTFASTQQVKSLEVCAKSRSVPCMLLQLVIWVLFKRHLCLDRTSLNMCGCACVG